MNQERIERFRSFFKEWDVEGALIENVTDLFYFLGLQLSAGVLLISRDQVVLFLDGRYLEWVKHSIDCRIESLSVALLKSALKSLGRIAIDSHTTTLEEWKKWQGIHGELLLPISRLTKWVRAIKDNVELEALNRSEELLFEGFLHILEHLRVGVKEREVAHAFELFCLKKGAEKLAFDPIIAFGANSAYPHYRAGNATLRKDDIVLCDVGVVLDHYHSDMTRMIFQGKVDSELSFLDDVVKKAQAEAIRLCKSGMKVGDLDRVALEIIREADLERWVAHSLGHGIGLETHEFPRLKHDGEDRDFLLQKGMTITIEPGLYVPGLGGIRWENRVVIE